ncbi:2428_t:CDS:2 [Ambispora leptoticha]|uniref:2428_t:CDS:1 n=1 Tax=Ambispora leptoticha TaxID=144679 RepID=A0A9N9B1H4_9GLOM|nr:2428_t:CDS:2 [Ambispora leptoticha]
MSYKRIWNDNFSSPIHETKEECESLMLVAAQAPGFSIWLRNILHQHFWEIEAKIHNPGPIAKKFGDADKSENIIVNSNKFELIKIFEKRTPLGNWQQASHGMRALENTVAALNLFKSHLKRCWVLTITNIK